MKRITIEPVSRIEGHAKITIQLDDDGKVADTRFQVTQVRGFEKFTEGRPFYEMPGITSRICGICPISHQLAAAKACDAIMAVRIPKAARLLREVVHCGQFIQSHALSFFYLSGPDLLLGMNADPETRNVAGLIEANPELARAGIELRKFGLQVIESLCEERVHPSWIVPGGVKSSLQATARDHLLSGIPEGIDTTMRALGLFKGKLDDFQEEIENFGSAPTMYAGLVDRKGNLQLYDGDIRFRGADGEMVEAGIPAEEYAEYIGEATLTESYLKAPYFKPLGIPDGIYRVGPLARINVAEGCGTTLADSELQEFRQRFGRMPHSAFLYHYARLIEVLYALERLKVLLSLPEILDTHIRASADVNALEGVGVIEAPRGTLIHHYKVDENGAIVWANLIVATGHNNYAIGKSVRQVSEHFVKGAHLEEGMLNRVSAVVRAYDPCLSCSTHALGAPAVSIALLGPDGARLDELRN
ncbi:MAG TPA: Ni/Fe hydrogenase subunit alpha [Candidatus Eisenbacteria bacterium]|nr:Ni/Fe hydrogenase subunit alpha [Candidatus Eisenbacteria bacterium]